MFLHAPGPSPRDHTLPRGPYLLEPQKGAVHILLECFLVEYQIEQKNEKFISDFISNYFLILKSVHLAEVCEPRVRMCTFKATVNRHCDTSSLTSMMRGTKRQWTLFLAELL